MRQSVISFPSQAVSDLEKLSEDYGLKIARAIKGEWFYENATKFRDNLSTFHNFC